ncbi:MAG: GntR family transcriptional regulator [Acidobacteriales bacterium]|uniref:GntR family transcriptional regulator n=1 Tax=Bradyrhizobium sp. TaxID=376 RepID=UPI001E0D704A|nr:GntR family transcriptional regulator [Bradyrhizobium sp.]MBV9565807.1 GntR family transcriptional regulator [Bradyrhizobium sp.]MBV9670269.1 GntR family transcriptional regulator [Terriglobales bacterium]
MLTFESEHNKKDAAYSLIKELAVNFRFRPGEHLSVPELSDRLHISATPVREALIQLYGERLVVAIPYRGFFAKAPDAAELEGIHEISRAILRYSIMTRRRQFERDGIPPALPFGRADGTEGDEERMAASTQARLIEHVFERIGSLSGQEEMISIVRNFNDRSHFIRVVDLEWRNLNIAASDEPMAIINALETGDASATLAHIDRHFDRMVRELPALAKEALSRAYKAQSGARHDGQTSRRR